VTKMRGGVHPRRRLRLAILVGALSAACLVPLAGPVTASASTVGCGGKMLFSDQARFTGIEYKFRCTENILAFSVLSTKKVDLFGTEQLAFNDTNGTDGSGELFSCEGQLPGFGFGCDTRPPGAGMLAGHTLIGEVGFEENPCKRPASGRPRLWLAVTTQQFDVNGKPYTTSSKPFELGALKCKGHIPQPSGAGKGKGHRHRYH
jgi:hypothetical protein